MQRFHCRIDSYPVNSEHSVCRNQVKISGFFRWVGIMKVCMFTNAISRQQLDKILSDLTVAESSIAPVTQKQAINETNVL